ncbi:hypothetical protein BCR44DRAFT_1430587 [Catenaria anguillulae PL171]|uniref:Nucleolar 27S pre-rRNA processing Urb2/Npa2 C-terminal domain-containing protein n=1 Tax=Catenaria anguillulae PL171 TaxID=765915 RepID=A0A1Y2HSS2_9FUNG|nr:hypothetical protein BCR44DRAFT_1430587 [Catenaria anguillulae PL171]
MADDLIKSLRSSAVTAAEKLPLAVNAYANPHLYMPRKADVLTDWAAPVFGLLASATSHILTALPDNAAQREILLTHVAACFTTLADRLRMSQKITLDAWADLVKAAAAHPPSTASLALTRSVLEAFVAVLAAYPTARKAMAATAAALDALLSLPTELEPLARKVLEVGLFGNEIISDMYAAATKVTTDMLLARDEGSGPSVAKRPRVDPVDKKNNRKKAAKDTPTGPFAGVIPEELAAALQATPESDAGRTYATVLDVALTALAQAENSAILAPQPHQPAVNRQAVTSAPEPTVSLVFTNKLFATVAPRLSLTDDREDVLNRAIRSLLSDTPPGPAEALDRFYVDALMDLAAKKENWGRAGDVLYELVQVFGQARMLNVLFVDLGRVGLRVAPGKWPYRVLGTYLCAMLATIPASASTTDADVFAKFAASLTALTRGKLTPAIPSVARECAWCGLGVVVQALGVAADDDVQQLAGAVVKSGFKGAQADVGAAWSGAMWELGAGDKQKVYWWMSVVDHLDVLPELIGDDEHILAMVAGLLTQSIMDSVPSLDDEQAGISISSVSTQALLSAQFYEIAWLRPYVAKMFVDAQDAASVLRKVQVLALFPPEYFSPAERSLLAQRLVSAAIKDDKAWDPMVVKVALALDLPVNPTSLDQAMANASTASPDLTLRLAYKLTLRLLQQSDASTDDRAALVSALLSRPQFHADAYFALRVVLEWVSAERGHARVRADLVSQIVAELPEFATGESDPVRAAFVFLLAKAACGKNATSTAVQLSHVVQNTGSWVSQALNGTVEPLVIRALEVLVSKFDADDSSESAFVALYSTLLNDHVVTRADQVANWLAVVHTMSASAKHERSVRKLLRQVLLRLEQLVEHVTCLPDLLALLALVERLLERVPRLSTRSLSHFQLLLSTLLGQSFAARFFASIPLESWSKSDRESLFLAVANVLAAMLHHQRHALVHSPVMFTVHLRDLLQCFLEPGRYAQKHLTTTVYATAVPTATHDNSTDALAVSRLPLALLTSLAPLPASCAWAWHRLIQGIGTLPTSVLVSLQGMPTSKVIDPIAAHLPALVAEFMQWHAFTVHAGHPRFGWAIVADAKVRAALMRGVYEAMDLVGEQGRVGVLAMVPASGKGAYKEVVREYEKYHQFKGKV